MDDKLKKLKGLLGPDYQYIDHTVNALREFTEGYPASNSYHGTGKTGLFNHLLDTAIKCTQTIKRHIAGFNEAEARKYTIASALTGLLHDIGKVADYSVETGHRWQWTPLAGHRLSFFEEKGEPYKLVNISQDSYHAFFSAAICLQFIAVDVLLLLGRKILYQMLGAIALHHIGHPTLKDNPLYLSLKDADRGSVAVERKRDIQEFSELWLTALRRRINNSWQNGYHYFLTTDNLLLVVNPLQTKRLLRDLHNETGKYIDEAEILTELYNKGITKRIREKTKDFCDVEITDGKRTIKLNTLAVMAKKVLGAQEMANMKRFTWRVLKEKH